MNTDLKIPSKFIFTITAGRTGTAWLTEFIKVNSSILSVHEYLDFNDFGTKMPDIRTMRTFNEVGMTKYVIGFWNEKFKSIKYSEDYCESNHTLAKCGLIEYLINFTSLRKEINLIVLRRNKENQALSYLERNDFQNITIHWQWYLSPKYRKNILDPKPFIEHGIIGIVFWYIYEMEVRQEYYRIIYQRYFRFHIAYLEEITNKIGAEKFAKSLGLNNEIKVPPPKNQQLARSSNQELLKKIKSFHSRINIDSLKIAKEFVRCGRTLG